MKRHGYIIGGQVQGVGFRPFVYRAATRLRLTGHVGNTSDGVRVEVQGTDEALAAFAHALEHELPPLAQITSLRREELPLADGEAAFADPADRATAESDRSFTLRIRDRERRLIHKIQEAIKRMDDGVYGVCEECGEDIGVARLKARPVTTLCVSCKARQEEGEDVRGN